MEAFLGTVKTSFGILWALAAVKTLDIQRRLQTLFEKPNLKYLTTPDDSAPILILALWEKDNLRPDILNLIETAKAQGYFVLAINTGKLLKDHIPMEIGGYAEIANYGRDFASYKYGFSLVYKLGVNLGSRRMVMANDSVFYLSSGLPELLREAATSEIKALGATENFEIQRHLGSFFISLDGSVIEEPRFRKFWTRYNLTDQRRTVIHRGELKLSKTLIGLVGENQVRAIWDIVGLAKEIRDFDLEALSAVVSDSLEGPMAWKKARASFVAEIWDKKFRVLLGETGLGAKNIQLSIKDRTALVAMTVHGVFFELCHLFPAADPDVLRNEIKDTTINLLIESAASGSQIHNNALVFHTLGLPLVKLDLLYRGAAIPNDILKLGSRLRDSGEYQNLMRLLLLKPFGSAIYRGWELYAFRRGLI
jgi:hypothetical protein